MVVAFCSIVSQTIPVPVSGDVKPEILKRAIRSRREDSTRTFFEHGFS